MSRLLRGFYQQKHQRKHYCHICLCLFGFDEKLQAHLEVSAREEKRYEIPAFHSFLQFKEYQKCEPLPFVLYCNFEALNQPVHVHSGQSILKQTKHVSATFVPEESPRTIPRACTRPHMYRAKNARRISYCTQGDKQKK